MSKPVWKFLDRLSKIIFSPGAAGFLVLLLVNLVAYVQNHPYQQPDRWSTTSYHRLVAEGEGRQSPASWRERRPAFQMLMKIVQTVSPQVPYRTFYRGLVFLALLTTGVLFLFFGIRTWGLSFEGALFTAIWLAILPPVSTTFLLPDPPYALACVWVALAWGMLGRSDTDRKAAIVSAGAATLAVLFSEHGWIAGLVVGIAGFVDSKRRSYAFLVPVMVGAAFGIQHHVVSISTSLFTLLDPVHLHKSWSAVILAFSVIWVPFLFADKGKLTLWQRSRYPLLAGGAMLLLLEREWSPQIFMASFPVILLGAATYFRQRFELTRKDPQLHRLALLLVAILADPGVNLLQTSFELEVWKVVATFGLVLATELMSSKKATRKA